MERTDSGPARALAGRTALITGAGRGLGEAIALAFAREGALVAAAARTKSEVDRVADACGPEAIAIPLDVTDEAACRGAVTTCQEHFGRIDILVNCAGIASSQPFRDLDLETWRRVMAVDLEGPFVLTRETLPGMVKAGRGSVIMVGSISSRVGLPYLAAYTAAKHGLLGLTRSLAAEYGAKGITVNCVCPAYADTPLTAKTIGDIVARTGRSSDEARKVLSTPQGRLVDPADVAALCVLLASDAGRGINGQAINVDGGTVQS
jgi:NAD(P)-dependent dehydrogenase (short-subunit alcohol dehydrogenase family)